MFDDDLLALGANQETIDQYLFTRVSNILSSDGV